MKTLLIPESFLKEKLEGYIKKRDGFKEHTPDWEVYDLVVREYRALINKHEHVQDIIDETYLSAWKSCNEEWLKVGKTQAPSEVTGNMNRHYVAYVESFNKKS